VTETVTTVKTDSDNRLVDYLYDELSDAEREAFSAELSEQPAVAEQAQSYAALLSLVRDNTEELSPSSASTEQLVAAAHRAARPWWARLFGEGFPALLLRPAVGVVAMAVVALGIGVFVFLSGRSPSSGEAPGAGETGSSKTAHAPRRAETVASSETAPSPARVGDLEKTARFAAPRTAKADENEALAANDPGRRAEPSLEAKREERGLDALGDARGDAGFRHPQGKLARTSRRGTGRDRSVSAVDKKSVGIGGGGQARAKRQRRRTRLQGLPSKDNRPLRNLTERQADQAAAPRRTWATGKPTRAPAAAPKPRARRAPSRSALGGAVSSGSGGLRTGGDARSRRKRKGAGGGKASAPALYNAAQTHLAKGQVAQACQLFSSLVRHHQHYPRRADALLGWARCEMARGAYRRAEAIVRKLMREHKSWHKSGKAWLAEIARRRRRAAQRASQRAKARRQRKAAGRKTAPRRAAPRPATAN
jgi:TolA-binding protein